jgi:hypothetical protein
VITAKNIDAIFGASFRDDGHFNRQSFEIPKGENS